MAITGAERRGAFHCVAEVSQFVDLRPAKLALRQMTFARVRGSALGAGHDLFIIQMLRKLTTEALQGRNCVRFPPQAGKARLALGNMPVHFEQFARRQGPVTVAVELLFGEMFGLFHRRLFRLKLTSE